MKYRKKPIIVDAFKWTGDPDERLPEWITKKINKDYDSFGDITFINRGTTVKMAILTTRGTTHASLDDWIIHGIAGDIYPCKPDIFEATYEKVE